MKKSRCMFSIAQNAGEPDAVGRFKLLVPRYGITAVTVPTNMFVGSDLKKPSQSFYKHREGLH